MAPDQRASRRKVLQTAGVLGLGGLAGCSGDGDGDSTPTPGDDTTDEPTATPTPEPESYSATAGGVGADLGVVPMITAISDMVYEATDGRFSGEYQQFSSGRLSLQSVISNNIQLYTGGLGAALQAFAAGSDLRIIMPLQTGTDYVIAIREDVDGLEAFTEEGNGLQFGVSATGALSHTQAVGAFQANDLSADNVNFVETGGSSTRTAAVGSGSVDGTPIHRGQFERLQSEGAGVKSGAVMAEHYPNFIQAVLAMRQRELDEHHEYYQELANQVARANQRTMNDFEWIYEQTQRYQASPLSEEDARTTWEVNQELDAWPTEPVGTEPYQSVYDMMSEAGVLDVDLDLDTLLASEVSTTAFDNLE